jgi:hypothetical protein
MSKVPLAGDFDSEKDNDADDLSPQVLYISLHEQVFISFNVALDCMVWTVLMILLLYCSKDCEGSDSGDAQLGDDGDNLIGSPQTASDSKDGESPLVGHYNILNLSLSMGVFIC